MAKLVDIDSPFSERFKILHDRTGREIEQIYPKKCIDIDENGKERILDLNCNILVLLSLITEKGDLVFFETFKKPDLTRIYEMRHTDGKTKHGTQIRPTEPILLLRKAINEIKGEDWYGDDKDAIIIFETYHCQDAGPSKTFYFLKKINDKQLEIFKKWAKENREKITFLKIDEIPEEQKKDIIVQRIILLENLFNPKTAKPL